MIAKQEVWKYTDSCQVWVGKYKNSQNLMHWHHDCELLHVEQGSIEVYCEQRLHRLKDGDTLFIDTRQMHYMHASEPETVLSVIIFDYKLIKPFAEKVQLASPKLFHSYKISELYERLRNILASKRQFFAQEAASVLVLAMIDIFRKERLVQRVEADSFSQSFWSLLEEIDKKYEYFTFEDAVAFMGMSESYFSRYFRTMAGITFSQYLNHIRIIHAVELLRSEKLPVTEIAFRCGFSTIRNFNRIFKELTGFTPSTLPADFVLNDIPYPSGESFNVTLVGCKLIDAPDFPNA